MMSHFIFTYVLQTSSLFTQHWAEHVGVQCISVYKTDQPNTRAVQNWLLRKQIGTKTSEPASWHRRKQPGHVRCCCRLYSQDSCMGENLWWWGRNSAVTFELIQKSTCPHFWAKTAPPKELKSCFENTLRRKNKKLILGSTQRRAL